MYIVNANFCIGEASSYEKPDTLLCSLVEKIALNIIERKSVDLKGAGAYGLRLYGRVYGLKNAEDGSMHVTRPLDALLFVGDDKDAYACFGSRNVRIESFSDPALENIKLLAASALAGQMIE